MLGQTELVSYPSNYQSVSYLWNWECVLYSRNTTHLQMRQIQVSPPAVTRTDYKCYQYVWNQQPSNYSHPKQKPQSPCSRIASDAGTVLEEEDHFARPGGRLVIYCPTDPSSPPSNGLITQQPLQTAQMFTERSRQKHNQMALFVLNSSLVVWRCFGLETVRASDIQVRVLMADEFSYPKYLLFRCEATPAVETIFHWRMCMANFWDPSVFLFKVRTINKLLRFP
jgi:hypothetical protein